MVIFAKVPLQLFVVAVVHVLVGVDASAHVARLVHLLHVRVQLSLVVEEFTAVLAARVAFEPALPKRVVYVGGCAVPMLVQLCACVEHLLGEEHLPALEADLAEELAVLLAHVRLQSLDARVLRDDAGVAARVANALAADERSKRLDLAAHGVVVEEHVQLLVVMQLPSPGLLRERIEAVRADGLGVLAHVPRREHALAAHLADDAAPVVQHEP